MEVAGIPRAAARRLSADANQDEDEFQFGTAIYAMAITTG